MAVANFKSKGLSRYERRSLLLGLLFISPWLLGFLAFTVYPLAASFYYSLTRYDLIREPAFIGFTNYSKLFTDDPHFWTVMYNTFFYVLIGVPLGVATAFLIATLLNLSIKGRSFFRGVIYVPSIVPAVCSAMVWMFLLNVQYGAFNAILQTFGLPAVPFLANPALVKPTFILVSVWAQGAAVVIFLAALQNVPRSLYEAATVDGANSWHKFWNITIPMTTPIILFNLVMGFIVAFQEFVLPYLLTNGVFKGYSELYAVHLYRVAFVNLRMGKASAMAWILLVIIVLFTITLFRTSARWVYYGGEE